MNEKTVQSNGYPWTDGTLQRHYADLLLRSCRSLMPRQP